jgi:hypothetical protein
VVHCLLSRTYTRLICDGAHHETFRTLRCETILLLASQDDEWTIVRIRERIRAAHPESWSGSLGCQVVYADIPNSLLEEQGRQIYASKLLELQVRSATRTWGKETDWSSGCEPDWQGTWMALQWVLYERSWGREVRRRERREASLIE